ncbi:MAG TPA: SRPBCC domain-containing protein [Caulobacteraceae bacterium]|nr:SRPBCC domain-containing protein [Caulobacteraceae bacterium]
MAESRFVYVTYIRAAPEKIWEHLTTPELNKLFWGGYAQRSGWKVGDDYAIAGPDGRVWDEGKVLAADPPRRLQVTWRHLNDPAMTDEGVSTCSFELEPSSEGVTKLTLTHAIEVSPSKLIGAVSQGWPSILSSLKSLLETGKALA